MNTILLSIAAVALFSQTLTPIYKSNEPTQGGTYSLTISRDGQDVLKSEGISSLGAMSEKGIHLTFASKEGNGFSLNIFGSASGDYKFNAPTEEIKEDNLPKGHALFMLISSTTAKEFTKGMLFSTSGTLHITVTNNACSGHFEGSASILANGSFGSVKYKLTGSFKNVPLRTMKE
jgi:hypothetical protein